MSSTDYNEQVGFICPLCKTNYETGELLSTHYKKHQEENQEEEEQPVTFRKFDFLRRSLKKVFDKITDLQTTSSERVNASNARPVTVSEAELRTKDLLELFIGIPEEEKIKLPSRSHIDYWYQMRSVKTANILKNLDNFWSEKPETRSILQKLKNELEKTEDVACSSCQKQFKLTSRRRRRCKLCDAALCDNCSLFLDKTMAFSLLSKSQETVQETKEVKPMRHCKDCNQILTLVLTRTQDDDAYTKLLEIYTEMQNLKRQLSQTVFTYKEVHQSLVKGKRIHDATQAVMIKDHMRKRGKELVLLSERIAELPAPSETRQAKIQQAIHKAAKDFVKVDIP